MSYPIELPDRIARARDMLAFLNFAAGRTTYLELSKRLLTGYIWIMALIVDELDEIELLQRKEKK